MTPCAGRLRLPMNWLRVIVCIVLPPLAVVDKGVKPVILTAVLTFLGYIPGVVSALVYTSMPPRG